MKKYYWGTTSKIACVEGVDEISLDGGKVRLRTTTKGESCIWRDYKALCIHPQARMAWFLENEALVDWVNHQPLSPLLTCVGDGHSGIWNLMTKFNRGGKTREILDWFHLVENLYKVGGSNKRIYAQLYQLNQDNHGDFMGYQRNFMNNRDRFNLRSGVSLYKIGDLYPDYRSIFGKDDLMKYSLYGNNNQKVGSIKDILVDQEGNFRYLVVDTGFLGLGKKILLPFGSARLDRSQQRVYAAGLTKEQAENLPEYNDDMTVDHDYEERVRNVYRVQSSVPGTSSTNYDTTRHDRDSYDYDRDQNLYAHRDHDDSDRQG